MLQPPDAGASLVSSSSGDDNGHGTHAASSVAGAIHGVAKSAIVHSVKVLKSDGSGSFSTIIEGLKW
jgi:subtilisin family serine protease